MSSASNVSSASLNENKNVQSCLGVLEKVVRELFVSFSTNCQNNELRLQEVIQVAKDNKQLEHLCALDTALTLKVLADINKFLNVPLQYVERGLFEKAYPSLKTTATEKELVNGILRGIIMTLQPWKKAELGKNIETMVSTLDSNIAELFSAILNQTAPASSSE
jgi:hypothetical protein